MDDEKTWPIALAVVVVTYYHKSHGSHVEHLRFVFVVICASSTIQFHSFGPPSPTDGFDLIRWVQAKQLELFLIWQSLTTVFYYVVDHPHVGTLRGWWRSFIRLN